MNPAPQFGPAPSSPKSREGPRPIDRAPGGVRVLTVTDLHQRAGLYRQLHDAVDQHQPDLVALVGDLLDVPGTGAGMLPVRECAEALSRLPASEILFVRGNHEDMDWLTFADAWAGTGRRLNALHGEPFLAGPLAVMGFPCLLGNDLAFTLGKPPMPVHYNAWLPGWMRKLGPAGRTLWLMHEPPLGNVGCPEWKEAIERYQPWLCVSGHDHQEASRTGRWHVPLGATLCVNLGQPDGAALHYAVIDFEFASPRTSLPRQVTVTAYPHQETIVRTGDGIGPVFSVP